MDTATMLDEALLLMDETALLSATLAPEVRHELIGPLLVAHGIVRSVRALSPSGTSRTSGQGDGGGSRLLP